VKEADIKKLGKYDILGELGKGAMGVVYKGQDPFIERFVALKTVRTDLLAADDPEATTAQITRFKREAQAAGRINHPNIVGIYEYGEDGPTAFIAMEFIEGRDLKDYFDKTERFDLKAIVRIMSDTLSALDYAHKHGIVHRDIKPANIMLTSAGEVKITDFGIARLESSNLTQAGTVMGTPSYMSPEQFMGQQVDARSDIFSAGGVLYQLLTGEKPFTGSLTTIMHRVLHAQPEPPSVLNVQISPDLDRVVAKAMAKRPDDRFQSAAEFGQALRDAVERRPAPAAAPVAVEEPDSEATLNERTLMAPEAMAAPKTAAPAAQAEDLSPRDLMSDAAPRAAATAKTPSRDSAEPAAKGGGKGMMIGAAAGVLVVVGGVAGWMMIGKGPAPEPSRPEPARLEDQTRTQTNTGTGTAPSAEEQARQQRAAEEIRRQAEERVRQQQAAEEIRRQAEEQARQQQAAEELRRQAEERARQQQTAQQTAEEARRQAEERARQQQAQQAAEERARQQQAAQQAQQAQQALEETRRQAEEQARQQQAAQQAAEEAKRKQAQQVALAENAFKQVRTAVARVNCGLLKADSRPEGGAAVSGVVGEATSEAQVRAAIEAAAPGFPYALTLDTMTRPMCEPLTALSRPRERNQELAQPLGLRASAPGAVFRNGQDLTLELDGPGFAANLQVDYFTLEGYVVHLLPNGLEKDAALAAGGHRRLGNRADGGRFWTIGPPFGRELIVVVASAKPLFAKPRPEAEQAGAYLGELRKALEAAAKTGGPAPVAAALVISTVAN
jgi:predicted Ser/Thr protein kinase